MNKETKTVSEWFQLIEDEDIRTRALRNLDASEINTKVSSISRALDVGFNWRNSPEKGNYWSALYSNNPKLKEPNKITKNTYEIY